ncbi:MAG: hypothetical protein JWR20_2702 [Marmoricola sp.]|nr:hypothetical protein [Marmoricola sp.]
MSTTRAAVTDAAYDWSGRTAAPRPWKEETR